MSGWDALSVIALAAASVPSIYFAGKILGRDPEAARLSVFLGAALLVHAGYHTMAAVGVSILATHTVESVSAVLILVFAILYWREREDAHHGT